jgi:RNA polymerase-binding protein DksA
MAARISWPCHGSESATQTTDKEIAMESHLDAAADRVRDPGDEAVVDLLADLEYADIDRHIGALRATEAALRAWHDGRYGVCADCGGPIPYARLEAYPTASRCIDCQAEYERAGGPTPRL